MVFLNNLKIRTKLIIYLIVPILTILFFAISGIHTKINELQDIKGTHEFTSASLILTDVVYELQKERGLSAGFIGSGGKDFKTDMLKQRVQTDEKLNLFNQKLDINSSSEEYWGLSNKFTILRRELSKLSGVRNSINTLKEGDGFKYYSNINTHAINIIQYLQVLTNDALLARLGDAFASLLLLQERAGQERGAMNSVLTSKKLDIKHFQEISTYIADQRTILNNYYAVVSSEHKSSLQKNLSHPIVQKVNNFRASAINKSRKNELLNDLQMKIGYGGLIHNFKNYIIRGRDGYLEHFYKTSIAVKNIIEKYKNLIGISPQEINYLKIIDTTFDQYHTMLKNVIKMKKIGHSVIEVDRLVEIDDTPALNAIKSLRKDITSSNTSKWWESATFRIELIKNVSDDIKLDMVFHNQQSMSATTQSVILYITLSIVSIAMTLFLGLLIMQRLVDELVNMSTNMRDMQERNNSNKRLVVNGSDEISDMANAFNNLIHEREQQDEQLYRSQKMDALGKLTGGIVHDYNNMLGVILGYANVLQRKLKDQPKLSKFAQNIIHASERNAELTNKLLDFSGQSESNSRLVDINQLLNDEHYMLEKVLTARIQLTLDLSEDLWPVWLDYGDLVDAIINLCINSMHATDENGQLTIKTSNKHINISDAHLLNINTGPYVTLSIIDTGCGMDDDTMKKIFDPFYSTKGDGGTGMGLSRVYGFVNRSNGSIKVHSKPGHGSQFIFYFPRYQGHSDNSDENKQDENEVNFGNGETILIVDDEPALRDLAYEILSQHNYQIICAENGLIAKEVLKNKPVDLVLSDIIMPEFDGYQLASFIQDKYPSVKIQLTSGYNDDHDIDITSDNLKKNLLHKPYTPQTLLNHVRNLLDEKAE